MFGNTYMYTRTHPIHSPTHSITTPLTHVEQETLKHAGTNTQRHRTGEILILSYPSPPQLRQTLTCTLGARQRSGNLSQDYPSRSIPHPIFFLSFIPNPCLLIYSSTQAPQSTLLPPLEAWSCIQLLF